jgi:hypothetical protein
MKTYDGKTVEFLCELGGRLMLLTGEFVLRTELGRERLEIHYTGRLSPGDPPLSDYAFKLSDPHMRSLAPARNSSADTDYLLEKPLRLRDRVIPPMVSDRAFDGTACR